MTGKGKGKQRRHGKPKLRHARAPYPCWPVADPDHADAAIGQGLGQGSTKQSPGGPVTERAEDAGEGVKEWLWYLLLGPSSYRDSGPTSFMNLRYNR